MTETKPPSDDREPNQHSPKPAVLGSGVHPMPVGSATPAIKPAPDRYLAPGCFGYILAYDATTVQCQTCPFFAECGPAATERITRIRAELGITPDPEPVAPRKKTKPRTAPTDAIPLGASTDNVQHDTDCEAGRRTASLNWRLSCGRLDKRYVKLKGRTDELVRVWVVRQMLRAIMSGEPDAVEVSRQYNERYSAAVSARSMRRKLQVVSFLESSGHPWHADKLARSPSDCAEGYDGGESPKPQGPAGEGIGATNRRG